MASPRALGLSLGLAETGHAIALFPKAAFLEEFDALKAFQNVPFGPKRAGPTKTTML
jgi:hypothetical protein